MIPFNTIAYGLTIGAILYIVSIGLSLTFGTMKIVNFAHAFIYTIGAYFLITFLALSQNNFLFSTIIAVILVIPISYVIERFVIRKLYGVSIDLAIIATYAVLLIGVDLIKWIWGTSPISLSDPLGGRIITFLNISLPLYRIIVILLAIILFFLVSLFFKLSVIGKIVIAALEDREAVRSLGIKVDKYFSFVFILGSCLAALGGVLYAPIISINPYMGSTLIIMSFAVVIIGGLGNIQGTAISAFVLGIVMALTGIYWPPAAEVVVFLIMVVSLIFKPIDV